MKIRASKNAITSIYNDVGMKISEPKAVEKEFLTFFTKLMGDENGLMPCPNSSIIKSGECLTIVHQKELIHDLSLEEVDADIKDMSNDKAPGVDGFPI